MKLCAPVDDGSAGKAAAGTAPRPRRHPEPEADALDSDGMRVAGS